MKEKESERYQTSHLQYLDLDRGGWNNIYRPQRGEDSMNIEREEGVA